MSTFIEQARRCLPEEAPVGTLLTVPIQKQTGNIPLVPGEIFTTEYDLYKFLRTKSKWIYLGKGKIRENQKHLFQSVDWNLRK
jgi:hypothetical protein